MTVSVRLTLDGRYVMTTPENIAISYELAGLGSRFLAAMLDGLVILVIQLGLIFLAMIASMAGATLATLGFWDRFSSVFTASVVALVILLAFASLLGYPLLFEIIWNGQTPGKRMTGIRVVRDDGSPVTPLATVIRNVVRLADFLPAYYVIGVVVMLVDRKARRLGDMAAGTICVKERPDMIPDDLTADLLEGEEDEPAPEGGLSDLSRLSYDDYHLVKEYLLRSNGLAPAPAHNLAVQIAGQMAAKLGVELGEESPEDFLFRVGVALERQGWR